MLRPYHGVGDGAAFLFHGFEAVEGVGFEGLFEVVDRFVAVNKVDADEGKLICGKLFAAVQHGLRDDKQRKRAYCRQIQSRTDRHADACRKPHACRRRQAVERLPAVDDDSCAEEAYAGNDLRGNAGVVGLVRHIGKGVFADDHHQRSTDGNDEVRLYAGDLFAFHTLEAERNAQKPCKRHACDVDQFVLPITKQFFKHILPQAVASDPLPSFLPLALSNKMIPLPWISNFMSLLSA